MKNLQPPPPDPDPRDHMKPHPVEAIIMLIIFIAIFAIGFLL